MNGVSGESEKSLIDREKFVTGYTRVGIEEGDGSYNAGFSIYSAAYPLLQEYPGHEFQSGLFGSWMYADSEDPKVEDVWFYSTLEGGLGWWRDTEFPTETPKFIMGAVALGFCAWANGPGAGKGRDWSNPAGHYGVAQLSPNLLWPSDGVNLKQGTCGELFGYGYLPLPLTHAKTTTAGVAVPTGDQSWTLFMNTANFKGPATFVLPYFYSGPSADKPEFGLDTVDFGRPEEAPPQTYVTPEEADSCWKTPGPVAGPFTARPGDGSEVTYYWYRFADQPALLNADLSDEEREELQTKVEKIHRHWTKDREYLAPPAVGTLAEIDPELIVTPPAGLEIGYVPIATKQRELK